MFFMIADGVYDIWTLAFRWVGHNSVLTSGVIPSSISDLHNCQNSNRITDSSYAADNVKGYRHVGIGNNDNSGHWPQLAPVALSNLGQYALKSPIIETSPDLIIDMDHNTTFFHDIREPLTSEFKSRCNLGVIIEVIVSSMDFKHPIWNAVAGL